MASKNVIYQKVSDEVARMATAITVDSGTPDADPNYAPSMLVDENPAKVAKIDSTTGSFLFDFNGVKTVVQMVGLIHHTFDAGLDVRIEGNNTNSWGSPSFVAQFVIPTWLGSGVNLWPVNPWLDLTTVTPLSGAYDATGFKFWRLHIVGTNSQNIQLGQVWFGALIRRLTPNVQWSPTRTNHKLLIDNVTSFGVSTMYSRHTAMWEQAAQVFATDALNDALDSQWFDGDGRAHPFLLVPDGLKNVCYLVRWTSPDQDQTVQFIDYVPRSVNVTEVSRGLRPGV